MGDILYFKKKANARSNYIMQSKLHELTIEFREKLNGKGSLEEKKKVVEAAAKKYREILGIDNEVKVSVSKIIDSMNAIVAENSYLKAELSGILAIGKKVKSKYKVDSEVLLILNQNDSIQHKRFTIVHEVYHYLFQCDYGNKDVDIVFYTYRTDEDENENEKLANYFAANVLIDKKLFRQEYAVCDSVKLLAHKFFCSETAIGRRIIEVFK